MEKDIVEGDRFSIGLMKKKPKKNPVTYKLETVNDIFQMLTTKNINRFVREFKAGMLIGIIGRELSKEECKQKGIEWDNSVLQMSSFTWIDD